MVIRKEQSFNSLHSSLGVGVGGNGIELNVEEGALTCCKKGMKNKTLKNYI